MSLKIKRKHYLNAPKLNSYHKDYYKTSEEDKKCKVQLNAAYAWNVQWKIDDIKGLSRIMRGTTRDRRT